MDQHPRILVATDNLRDQINGVAVTFKHLAIQAENSGYQMHFIDPSQFWNFSFPAYKEIKLALPYGISRKIESIRPDYIHIATEGPIGLATKLYCDRNNIAYNTSYHTKFPEYLKLYRIPVDLTYRYMRWFHKHSGVVLTTTERMCELLKTKQFESPVIPWTRGVDRSNIKPRTNKTLNVKPIVLYVGRVSPEKNLEELLKLQNKYYIIVVGDGPSRVELESKYRNAMFVGYKTGEELFKYYAKADVFCFPSKTDTFGIVMIEAMSCGTPIAAYPIDGPLDIVEDGVTGFLGDDLNESIKKCLQLDRSKIVPESEKWTWENCWCIFEKNLTRVN